MIVAGCAIIQQKAVVVRADNQIHWKAHFIKRELVEIIVDEQNEVENEVLNEEVSV